MKIDFWFSKGQFFLSMCMRISWCLPLVLLVVGCGVTERSAAYEPRPKAVKVADVYREDYVNRDFAGMATADDAVNLAFKISGQVLSVDVSKGDFVESNTILARLDPRDVELQVAADRSQFERAKSQYERMERLLEHEAVSRQEVEAAQVEYVQSQSTYENSRDLLHETKLRAPFPAVVERTFVDAYQRVDAGSPILRLVNPLSTTVEFTIPEGSLPLLADSTTTFSVSFDNLPDVVFAARLHKYAKTASDASGFPVALKISPAESRRYGISPGMTCQITMRVAEPYSELMAIPLTAVYAPSEGGTFAWVVVGDSIVEQRSITLGYPFGRGMVSVVSGLAADERVVSAGVYQLQSGQSVKIINQ